ncbi:unnamed protein product, partial [Oppiella nova]
MCSLFIASPFIGNPCPLKHTPLARQPNRQFHTKRINNVIIFVLDIPLSRASAWTYDKTRPVNNNDDGLNCGDFSNQVNLNAGKCGICGDPYNGDRENEFPNGKYAKNPKTYVTYKAGSNITAQIHVVANHDGYYEFRICNATDPLHEVTQECLNQHQLEVVGTTDNKWRLPAHKNKCQMGQYDCDENWINEIPLKLPAGFVCERCVFQWDWTTREYVGECGNGTYALGCGPQHFLHYPYVYKFGVEPSQGLDLPPITICTERDVFLDKTRIVRHFNLSDDYESYKLWAKQYSNDLVMGIPNDYFIRTIYLGDVINERVGKRNSKYLARIYESVNVRMTARVPAIDPSVPFATGI